MSANYALQMMDIEKSFNGIPVLKKAHFSIGRGEVHALCGGNGAGKSTLMKILTGVYTKDAGIIQIDNQTIDINNDQNARKHGIAMIFQEFSLIPTLTVAQNIFLAREPRKANGLIDDKECVRATVEILKKLNVDIDPNATVDSLGVGYWQMIEIAKALSKDAKILIMDEPTASLSESETESLFKLVNQLKAEGISIVYISHRMAEIFEICDRLTVLKDGKTILTDACRNLTMEQVIESMMGEEAGKSFKWVERNYIRSEVPVLKVTHLAYEARVKDVSFQIYPGEIVGLAGLMGSGRTEIMKCIFGIERPTSGEIVMNGKAIKTTADAVSHGIALVPEDRRKQGLVLDHTVRENMMLPSLKFLTRRLFVKDKQGTVITQTYIEKLNIKTDNVSKIVKLLSGGNQQKIVLAKWLARNPKVLLLDEPTIGVDIAAKSEIVDIIRAMAGEGMAILVISSELEELLAVSDRILVLYNGVITKELDRREVGSEEVLHHAIQGF
ncbi:sugar ABC transporter ATP-binding protein [Paenibacillus validus]|uniref:sugar ABC transporter ATP-binding protein n=1 Tax=Paenibacillus validus TaxID=44253 RepID=UPI000FDA85B2|nr:sugar ABC transporter ATP-binding protein [Paenibacillus validus]MED4599807.1 sugar ABC transporter ATP-binding protein [Paenibacillus validus]MED4604663.1 sugar ABC transporter ATP-binding protein [Paenibacillus validus]